MYKTGLGLLNYRQGGDECLDKLLSEDELPPLFKTFLNLYEVEYRMLNLDRVLVGDDDLEVFVKIEMFDDFQIGSESYTATIDMVLDHNQLHDEFHRYKRKDDHWHDEGLMKIGLMFHGDTLLIGVAGDKTDEVWRYGNGVLKTKCSKLDNNIFEFFSRLKQTADDDRLDELGISEKNLYKNWNDDFWRVRV